MDPSLRPLHRTNFLLGLSGGGRRRQTTLLGKHFPSAILGSVPVRSYYVNVQVSKRVKSKMAILFFTQLFFSLIGEGPRENLTSNMELVNPKLQNMISEKIVKSPFIEYNSKIRMFKLIAGGFEHSFKSTHFGS